MFNFFPHSDFNKVNLDWIMRKLKEQISGLVASVNGMTGNVTLTASDVGALPDTYTPPVESVNGKTGAVNLVGEDVPGVPGIPPEFDRAAYKKAVMDAAMSYIYGMTDTDCVTERAVTLTPPMCFKPVYETTGKNWQSLLQKDAIYSEEFTAEYTEGTPPILYLNCTGLVGLCVADRPYTDSVYYKSFTNPAMTKAEKQNAAMEAGTWMDKPYTLDWLRMFHTFQAFKILRDSGCPTRLAYEMQNGVASFDDSVHEWMETGDILYHANNTTNYADGVHHCMMYIKTLDEIEAYNEVYRCKFRAVPFNNGFPNDGEWGYIIHCSWGITTTSTGETTVDDRNVIRIESLKQYLTRANQNKEWTRMYVCKPYSNFLNSSKAARVINGLTIAQGELRFGNRIYKDLPTVNKFVPDDNAWYMGNVQAASINTPSATITEESVGQSTINTLLSTIFNSNLTMLASGDDMYTLPGGMYYWTSAIYPNILNMPTVDTAYKYGTGFKFYANANRFIFITCFGGAVAPEVRICFRNGGDVNPSGWLKLYPTT